MFEEVPRFSTPTDKVCCTPNIPSITHRLVGRPVNDVLRDNVSYNEASALEVYDVVNVEGVRSTAALGEVDATIGCIETKISNKTRPSAGRARLPFIHTHLSTT